MTNNDAMTACRNNLIDQTRKNCGAVNLWCGPPHTVVINPRKPIIDQMIIPAGKAVGEIGPVLRQNVDAQIAIRRDSIGDPAA